MARCPLFQVDHPGLPKPTRRKGVVCWGTLRKQMWRREAERGPVKLVRSALVSSDSGEGLAKCVESAQGLPEYKWCSLKRPALIRTALNIPRSASRLVLYRDSNGRRSRARDGWKLSLTRRAKGQLSRLECVSTAESAITVTRTQMGRRRGSEHAAPVGTIYRAVLSADKVEEMNVRVPMYTRPPRRGHGFMPDRGHSRAALCPP